ncbi:winged helix-turn-helix transcriptional regulator [Streptoalloteichus hindustanus]|uniref:Transcriptional regulator, HxlR family n=1 Tax=Streptoalloteichus hindustanus TaxID=2017 RepID=A0A1M5F5J4_STRHI|nr:helix-turn-helix domain-containing protein [Streptoalloteichus hindustanus]SHF86787.1 transcriptional regulator, HxlR family [Streptoalloteichus hindustanus]
MGTGKDDPGTVWAIPPEVCPARTVVEVLANKWVMYVMGMLRHHGAPMRFNQLRRSLPGITQKMLTQTLRMLERDGLVCRTVHPTAPPQVEYELTPLGREAGEIAHAVGEWSAAHADEILAARRDFDNRASGELEPVSP